MSEWRSTRGWVMRTAEERALRALENWACAEQVPLDTFTESARETFVLNVAAEIREAEADGFKRGRQAGLEDAVDQVRHDCSNCESTGHEPSADPLSPHECEYCGRPAAAIRSLMEKK